MLAVCLAATSHVARADSLRRPTASVCSVAGCINSIWGSGQIAAGFGLTAFRPGQTFTPSVLGELSAVQLGLETITGMFGNVIAEIRPTVNGLPTATILAEAEVPGSPYTGGVLYTADFRQNHLMLAGGVRYAITLRAPIHNYVLAAFPPCPVGTGTNDYVSSENNGQTWSFYFQRDRSFIFQVCMDAPTGTRRDTWGQIKSIYR